MSVNIQKEVDTFIEYLDTFQREHPDLVEEVASFVEEQIIDEDVPETYAVATAYMKWAGMNPDLVRGVKPYGSCVHCSHGWAEYEDGSVYPCPECRKTDHVNWHSFFVDQNREPS